MKPLRTWLARLGVFGALAIVSGCGSGDVPDPSADGEVAQIPEGSAPPAPTPPPQNVAADDKAADAKAEETTAQAQPAEPAPTPAAASEPSGAGAAPPDRNSATAEMLALATKEQPAPAPSGDAAPAAADAPAAGPAGAGGPPNTGPAGAVGPNAGMSAGQMQQSMQQGMQGRQAQMRGQMQQQNQMQGRMQPGGGMGPGGGGPGMAGDANTKPADFRTGDGAVNAFLDALKARDLGRLTEATALHAQTEASKRNLDMFKRIIDGSFSNSDFDDLAAKLEGYSISSFNQAKSTGRLGVVLSKRRPNTNNMLTIVITVRREKKGWGVCDISAPAELKSPRLGPMRGGQSKR